MGLPNFKEIIELVKTGATIEAQEKIMELRETVVEQQEENLRLRQQINELQDELDAFSSPMFDTCPSCRKPGYRVTHSEPDDMMGDVGVLNRTYICKFCEFTEILKETGRNDE